MLDDKYLNMIADSLSISSGQVRAAIELFDTGSTIPFVARYRKDVTRNLDEEKLEHIAQRNQYYTALNQRRTSILDTIEKQGKLTDELRTAIEACTDKNALEDLYLPYKKRKRTKATVAREQGLEPLAEFLWRQTPDERSIEEWAQDFVLPEKSVDSLEGALEGARHILSEWMSMDADGRSALRDRMFAEGKITSCTTKNSDGKKTKYEAYYDFSEDVKAIPSHRFLAILRGVKEGLLRMELVIDTEAARAELAARFLKDPEGPFASHIKAAADDAYGRLMAPSIENEVLSDVRRRADEDAIHVFRENARSLLMAPPAGRISVIGLDPGIKTGCKLAVIDDTGAYQESGVIHLEKTDESGALLNQLIDRYNVKAVAIGNGTGSREAQKFVNDVLGKAESNGRFSVLVNEAGASVYSASKVAREEFPDLDVTIRGAVSIARRLQDPLAELVKIEPRSIGVGQYQHDVNQKLLREGLHNTVVSCVNKVGVDLNTASVPLLRYVSGIQYGTAQNIVAYRTEHGGFRSREELSNVPGIGPKVFEQCAGFLRIVGGDNPLDSTAIHPENYPLLQQFAERNELTPADLIRNEERLKQLDWSFIETETVGKWTIEDIRAELKNPGRDPRREFKVPKFLEGVESVNDLEVGMEVEGVVTNVTNFGAFVDIGVHQDGLVHLSELANRFVRDPRQIARVGEIVKVKVIGVDKELPRISLSMKALQPAPQKPRRRKPADAAQQSGEKREGAPAERAANENRGSRGDIAAGKKNRKQDRRGGKSRKSERPQKGRKSQPQETAPLNTQLADQLASLKDKFSS